MHKYFTPAEEEAKNYFVIITASPRETKERFSFELRIKNIRR